MIIASGVFFVTIIKTPTSIVKQFDLEKFLPYCLKCSNCQICPVTDFSEDYTPTESFVYDIISSEDPLGNVNLWKCVSCHYCQDVCPFGLSPHNLFMEIKAASYSEGKSPSAVTSLIKSIVTTGRGFGVSTRTDKMREKLGLSPLTSNGAKDVLKLSEITGATKHIIIEKEEEQ